MKMKRIGRSGWYKIIHVKNEPKAMYKTMDKEEFIQERDHLTLREYINYTNTYDASGVVAFTLGKHRIVPSNRFHLHFLLYKIQMILFGESSIKSPVPSSIEYKRLQFQKEELFGEKLALLTLYEFEESFQKGEALEECCNLGGKIELNNFQIVFWIYEMLLQKTKGKIEIPSRFQMEALKYESFVKKYPNAKVINVV